MQIEYGQGRTITLTSADQFALQFMLGIVGQGHGHVRVRGTVPAIKYLRLAHNLGLLEARKVQQAAEEQLKIAYAMA